MSRQTLTKQERDAMWRRVQKARTPSSRVGGPNLAFVRLDDGVLHSANPGAQDGHAIKLMAFGSWRDLELLAEQVLGISLSEVEDLLVGRDPRKTEHRREKIAEVVEQRVDRARKDSKLFIYPGRKQ